MAVALPVVVGARLSIALRARRRSLCGASTIRLVLVGSWMVVIWPWRMPMASCTTFTTGARQLVVHEAAVTMRCRPGRTGVVDADHDVQHVAHLHRGGHDHALGATVQVALQRLGGEELAGALQHHVHAQVAPGDLGGDACDEKPSRRSPMRMPSRPRPRCRLRQRPCTLSNSSRCAVAAAPPFEFVEVHHLQAVARARVVGGRSAAPMRARSARRPMRPMPLMPTLTIDGQQNGTSISVEMMGDRTVTAPMTQARAVSSRTTAT
jgi:hypothetical protein